MKKRKTVVKKELHQKFSRVYCCVSMRRIRKEYLQYSWWETSRTWTQTTWSNHTLSQGVNSAKMGELRGTNHSVGSGRV